MTLVARLVGIASLLVASTLAGCSSKERTEGPGATAALDQNTTKLPASFRLAAAPASPRSVKELLAQAKSGDEVVVAGQVGEEGKETWFTLVDNSLEGCVDMGDECKTPWDFCCVAKDEMAKGAATVEFRDGAKPYPGSPLGFFGLEHLKHVVVKGRAEKDAAGNMVIVASGVFVQS